MKFSILFAVAASASRVYPPALLDQCDTSEPTAEYLAAAKEHQEQHAGTGNQLFSSSSDVTKIPLYVHVVATSENESDGYLTKHQIHQQVAKMNAAYADAQYHFHLKDIDWTVNDDWANYRDQDTMKQTLRKGDYGTLNLYFQTYLGKEHRNGKCAYPTKTHQGSQTFYHDGCSIKHTTVAEGSTAIHETGHWFGLRHTFEGGCDGDGDGIDDTPASLQTFYCPQGSDTCPDQPGLDPIHNYMSYNDCRSEFTPGQISRMHYLYKTFRQI